MLLDKFLLVLSVSAISAQLIDYDIVIQSELNVTFRIKYETGNNTHLSYSILRGEKTWTTDLKILIWYFVTQIRLLYMSLICINISEQAHNLAKHRMAAIYFKVKVRLYDLVLHLTQTLS